MLLALDTREESLFYKVGITALT